MIRRVALAVMLLMGSALYADSLVLKDGQRGEGKIDGFDEYLVQFTPVGGKQINVPWDEVAQISESEITGASALFEGKLKPGLVDVTVMLEPLSSGQAFRQALFPGIFIHGWGHRYARNNDTFYSLAGAQLFSMLVVAGVVGNELTQDAPVNEDKSFTNYFLYGGVSVFALTWVWDMAFAGSSAREFNKKKGLALVPHQNGMMLGMRMEY